MPAITKVPKCTIWGTFSKLEDKTLRLIRADHRLGLHRKYRQTAELILIERGVALGDISFARENGPCDAK